MSSTPRLKLRLHSQHWPMLLGMTVFGILAQPAQAQLLRASSSLNQQNADTVEQSVIAPISSNVLLRRLNTQSLKQIPSGGVPAGWGGSAPTSPQLDIAQATPPLPTGEDVLPPDRSPSEPPPTPSPLDQEILDAPEPPDLPEAPALPEGQNFTISEIIFDGESVFTEEQLLNLELTTYGDCQEEEERTGEAAVAGEEEAEADDEPCPTLEKILNQTLSAPALYQVAADVAAFYAAKGYQTSGAVIELGGTPDDTILTIQLIEDQLERIVISESPLRRYVQDRLGVTEEEPLNVRQLQDKLRLLQIDPLIDRVAASLTEGSTQGNSILSVDIDEAPVYSMPLAFNNARSPSVGTYQQQITLKKTHIFGIGDSLSVGYTRSDGSDAASASYAAILNPNNDTLRFDVNYTENRIIEEPFNRIDILSDSASYTLTYRRPLYRAVSSGSIEPDAENPENANTRDLPTYQEFALTLGAQLRDSNSSLSGIPFQFADTGDGSGNTRSFVLQFGQEWTRQNAIEVLSLRSNFSLGVDAFGATITPSDFPLEVSDGRFFAWRGQGQWVRLLDKRDPNFLFALRGDIQLTGDPLLSSDKFSIGGPRTVRGYRQDSLVTDNGLLLSAEAFFPLVQDRQYGVLQIIPFVDYGVGWNSTGSGPPQSDRAAAGVGFQYARPPFRARIDFGFPLIDVDSSNSTWQEDGIHFSIQYSPSF